MFTPPPVFGDGPNTASESTASKTELNEFFWPRRVPGSELGEFLSAYYLCANANSPSFSQNSPSLPQNSVRLSEFSSPKQYSRNSIPPVSYYETKFRGLVFDRTSKGFLWEATSPSKVDSVQTRCIVKGEAQKSPLFWRFSGGFCFSQERLFFLNSTRKPLNFNKIADFFYKRPL